ncbi:MAG: signal peptidase II [Eubacterium sp.]
MHKKKHISCSIMIILIVAFDQLTKYIVSENISDGLVVKFIPGFIQFRYAENTGMAFSLFSGARWIFIALTLAVCAGVLWYMFSNKCKSLWLYWSLGVIVSGGIGNLIDRICFGYVVDFIEPVFVNFAVFNIADCAVTCGAVVLIAYLVIDALKKDKSENNE